MNKDHEPNENTGGEIEETGNRTDVETVEPKKEMDKPETFITRREMLEGLLAGGALLGAGQLLPVSAQTFLTQTSNTVIESSDPIGEVPATRSDAPATPPSPQKKPRKKTTKDKPKHGDATAKVYIDGLSIMCFDEDRPTQFVFVEDGHEPLELKVYRSDRPGAIYTHPPAGTQGGKVTIDIKRWKVGTDHDAGEFFEQETETPNDWEDFRWLPDMCKWHTSDKLDFKLMAKNHLSGKLVIQDAVFYTKKMSRNKAKLDGSTLPAERVGRIIGANISGRNTDLGIVIKITGRPVKRLPRLGSKRQYYIVVGPRPGAMVHEADPMTAVYDHIIQPTATRYSLRYKYPEKILVFNPSTDDFDERKILSTEYACQAVGGGNGYPPNIP